MHFFVYYTKHRVVVALNEILTNAHKIDQSIKKAVSISFKCPIVVSLFFLMFLINVFDHVNNVFVLFHCFYFTRISSFDQQKGD